ncbi:MAG TPA: vitamin K epoxide reductase family protein [Candidatus Saccharimonadales bacterium]
MALRETNLAKVLPWILILCGVIGFMASFTLTVDKMEILKNPNYNPICNINPVLSCGSVMKTKQAELFGFDNSFMGLAAFSVLITVGAAMVAGAQMKRWFWQGLQGGVTFGLIFVHWLILNSLYRIHSLCPFCMVVWVVTITTFVYVTLYNMEHGNIKLKEKHTKAFAFVKRHHVDLVLFWLLIIAALILKQFWYYYGPRLGF